MCIHNSKMLPKTILKMKQTSVEWMWLSESVLPTFANGFSIQIENDLMYTFYQTDVYYIHTNKVGNTVCLSSVNLGSKLLTYKIVASSIKSLLLKSYG